MTVDVHDANGGTLSPAEIKLGGGPKRKLPHWLKKEIPGGTPLLNDEGIP